MREQLLYYALQYHGEWTRIKKAVVHKEPWVTLPYQEKYITIEDNAYPSKLKRLQQPPWVLFYRGDLSLCEHSGTAIIGSRNATQQGYDACDIVCSILKQRYVIISGLAKGIDGRAHYNALDQRTIGVICCGLDRAYPVENACLQRQMEISQLVISEYPDGCPPKAYHFPWRNRILAALSDAVIVIEAGMKSGTMLTVNEALTLDIPIYCIPHAFSNPQGKGGNYLIAQGAGILVDEEDIRMI